MVWPFQAVKNLQIAKENYELDIAGKDQLIDQLKVSKAEIEGIYIITSFPKHPSRPFSFFLFSVGEKKEMRETIASLRDTIQKSQNDIVEQSGDQQSQTIIAELRTSMESQAKSLDEKEDVIRNQKVIWLFETLISFIIQS